MKNKSILDIDKEVSIELEPVRIMENPDFHITFSYMQDFNRISQWIETILENSDSVEEYEIRNADMEEPYSHVIDIIGHLSLKDA